ncbi:Uncharacterized protein FWK35_00012112 [Aphis craccivora]|uniref:THAP-type domain-containing protein n=1 Tax=Aphis craccivora TaxID=307492 RepID=A0A6G0YLN8_APHCR|nr:Uncharacterized protein FWK35_00012112 [Aphis craccivora]
MRNFIFLCYFSNYAYKCCADGCSSKDGLLVQLQNYLVSSSSNIINLTTTPPNLPIDSGVENAGYNYETVDLTFIGPSLKDIINNGNVAPTARRYSEEDLIALPNPSAIRHWVSNVNAETGIFQDVLLEIGRFPKEDKFCCLILDSMSIKKSVQWDKLKTRMEMANWDWFVDKIKSNVQAQLIRIAITQCDKFEINVVAVTCDGAYANSSTFKTLGCDLDQPFDFIKSDFSITSTKANVYFTPDACHNVKLARNALGTLGLFEDSNNSKVNSSVADSLQFLSKTSKDFENCDATIRFIRVVVEIFDFLNSRNPYAKRFKQPINKQNIQYLETKMKNNIDYLYSLKTATGQDLWKTEQYNKPDNKLEFNSITIEIILYYISGYIVKKLIPTLKCDGCIEAITDPYIENDHVYQNNTTPKYFTIMKNRGGLKYTSDEVYKIVKLTETLFKTIMVDKKQMFIKNMDLKIMINVQNSLATDTTLFPECDACWNSTDLLARPHKIDKQSNQNLS